jgi:hypothetical protein
MTKNTTISLTFGDAGENHTGMEMLGNIGLPGTGFTCDELKILQDKFESAEYHDFGRDAGILIVRNFINQQHYNIIFFSTKCYNLNGTKNTFVTEEKRFLINTHDLILWF